MKLIPFTFTNEYDSQSTIQINPAFVVTLRPDGKTKTQILLTSGQITVDGKIDDVAFALAEGYDPALVKELGETAALDRMPETG